MSQESSEPQLEQQQKTGDLQLAGDENATAFVNAAGNATIDQSRRQYIINYYYREAKAVEADAALPDHLPCPYRGLFHFGPDDAEIFFGRELFVAELVEATQTRAFIPVLGASGSGKSSVVLAGLVPRLQQAGHWQFTHFRPGTDPFHALASAVVPLYTPELDVTDQIAQSRKLATYLRDSEVLLADVIAKIQQNYPHDRILLIADQFEELYTLCAQESIRRGFLNCLLAGFSPTVSASSPIVLMITMRADFLGNALQYRPFADLLQKADIKLGAMNRAELSQVVEKPAERLAVRFEAGLVNRILDDVENQPGNLPLLEFALTELWQRRTGKQITHAAYEAIGEVEGALARYADDKYVSLSSTEQEQVRRIFVQLVRPGEGTEDTRRLATKAELGEANWSLVKQLADVRLVVTSQDAAQHETVEVVHEALIRNWGKLRQWMTADRAFRSWQERLRAVMRQWESHRDEDSLLRGAALIEAEEQLQKRREDLSQAEQDFIQQSIDWHDRLQQAEAARRRRELKTAWGVAAGALIAVGVSTSLGLIAQHQQIKAELNQANALGQSSLSLFDAGRELDALVKGIQAGVILRRQKATDPLVVAALQTAVNGAHERNRLVGQYVVWSTAFSPDGETIATGSNDGTLKLWNSEGQLLHNFIGHTDAVYSVAFSPDGKTIATASRDKTVKLWNLKGQLLRTLTGHTGIVWRVVFSPDGQTIATASGDKTAKLWNLKGQLLRTLAGHTDAVRSVAFSPNGEAIATASDDKTARLWSNEAQPLHLLTAHTARVLDITFSPDGETIATASQDKTVKLWNRKGQLLTSLNEHTYVVKSVAFSPDSKFLATASWDKTVKLWNREGQFIYTIGRHLDGVNSVTFSPNGKTLATASNDKTARLWSLESLQLTLRTHIYPVRSVAFSPDGKTVATAGEDNTAMLWNQEGQLLHTLTGHTNWVNKVIFSPDGQTIATGSGDGSLKLWNVRGELLRTLIGHGDAISAAAFSPDGQIIATGSDDKTAKLWNQEGQLLHTLAGHSDWVNGITFSPDGQIIATASADKTIKLWNIKGKLLHTFTGHTNQVNSVAFSPDGKFLATTSDDKTAKLWSREGQLIHTYMGHSAEVNSVAFSPDGKVIATASVDKTVDLWNQNGQVLYTLVGHTGIVRNVAFSPDGQTIATASDDKTAKLWDLKKIGLEQLMPDACKLVQDYLLNSSELPEGDRKLCD